MKILQYIVQSDIVLLISSFEKALQLAIQCTVFSVLIAIAVPAGFYWVSLQYNRYLMADLHIFKCVLDCFEGGCLGQSVVCNVMLNRKSV